MANIEYFNEAGCLEVETPIIMFCFCGIAYLLAWSIMKSLVPKYKPIEL